MAVHGGDLAGVGEEIVEGELRARHRRVRQVLLDRLIPARLEEAQAVPGREAHEAVHRAGSGDHLDGELLPELILRKDLPRDLDARQLLELGNGGTDDLVRPVVAIDQEAHLLAAVALPVEARLRSDGRRTRHGPSEEGHQHRRHAAERYPSSPRRHACLLRCSRCESPSDTRWRNATAHATLCQSPILRNSAPVQGTAFWAL